MSALVLITAGPIWESGHVVEMDSGFEYSPCVVELRIIDLYDSAKIKKNGT